jgi:pSer/pThr/pTyr-binding forkhead associated (FHA) protein
MWKLTIEDDEGKQTPLPLAHEEYGLGRGESNAVRLTDRNISRTHAILKKTGPTWFVKDLQSYNGTFVNGVRVVGEQALTSGDLVQIGDYRLELLDEAAVVPAVAAVPGAPPAPPVPPVHQRPNRLVVVVGPTPGQEFPLDKEHFSIGRSEEATISINHSSISRMHAELIALGGGRYEIVDKASANGIRINGVELKRGILEAGDALELGDVRMRFVGAGKIFRAGFDQSMQLSAVGTFESVAPSVQGARAKPGGVSLGKLVGLGAVAGAAVIGVAVFLLHSCQPTASGDPKHTAPATSEQVKQLEEARSLLAGKDVEGAHQKLLEIPDNSAARDDPRFKEIEDAWADAMFKKVEAAADTAEKRALLKQINGTPSVDPERRKKAADMLREIDAKEPPPVVPTSTGPVPTYTGPVPGVTNTAPTPVANTAPPAGAVPQGLADEDAKRRALEPKVWSGKASVDEIRMLKALCSHLQNRECRDRAGAMLKKKLEQQ